MLLLFVYSFIVLHEHDKESLFYLDPEMWKTYLQNRNENLI